MRPVILGQDRMAAFQTRIRLPTLRPRSTTCRDETCDEMEQDGRTFPQILKNIQVGSELKKLVL